VRGFESDLLSDRKVEINDAAAKTSQSFTTTSSGRQLSVGPTIEMNLIGKWSAVLEAFYHRPSYQKVTLSYTGTDDPTTTDTDERTLKSTVTERTKATYWDFPVLLRYRGLSRRRVLSNMFVEGGGVLRTVSKVATGVETQFADGTTAYYEKPAALAARTLPGVAVGAGLRFVDDVKIRVTPQVRYTFWSGSTFNSDSTRSRSGQVEIGIGLVF
jgi:hypothetical protein